MTREQITQIVFAKTSGRCWYCGAALTADWERDHSIPRSQGGAYHPDNLVPCCRGCNKSKNNRTNAEFKRYTKNKLLQSVSTTEAVFKRFPDAFSETDKSNIRAALKNLQRVVSDAVITWHGEDKQEIAA